MVISTLFEQRPSHSCEPHLGVNFVNTMRSLPVLCVGIIMNYALDSEADHERSLDEWKNFRHPSVHSEV